MDRFAEAKVFPLQLPTVTQTQNSCSASGRGMNHVSNVRTGLFKEEIRSQMKNASWLSEVERVPELNGYHVKFPAVLSSASNACSSSLTDGMVGREINPNRSKRTPNVPACAHVVGEWKGEESFHEQEDIVCDFDTSNVSINMLEEKGPGSAVMEGSLVSPPIRRNFQSLDSWLPPVGKWKDENSFHEQEDIVCDFDAGNGSISLYEEGGPSSVSMIESGHFLKFHSGIGREEVTGSFRGDSHNLESHAPVGKWKGEDSFDEEVDIVCDFDTFSGSADLFEEEGPTAFSGASHPPEPTDVDVMRTVCLPINQSKSDAACLMKTLSVKGPFLEDLSIPIPPKKPSPAILSPLKSLVEEPCELGASTSFPFHRASHCAGNSLLPSESEDKECIWDESLPPSGNVSPHSTAGSTNAVATMNIANRCCSGDATTSDFMLCVERNGESIKKNVRGDSLESTNLSLSRASDSSVLSDDSNRSNITWSSNKPHKGNDPRWMAILAIRARDGILGMSHFKLLKQLGCGDIGSVYLSELSGTYCNFAMKVMDKASLAVRKKLTRAQTEREILQLLDHPFLPTLYTHFETDRFLCLVIEYCPGGDLHTLRQRQPRKHFSEYAARFYAAEVLLALEYLHMLGVVYRDLKPENVLVRDDGHIMLSDFDLSLRCAVSPTLIRTSGLCVQPACIERSSACIQPSCFIPHIFSPKNKKKNQKPRADNRVPAGKLPELVAEPTTVRSMSFVGTHEYLAPEIIKGEGHGSAVDWWTLGIFLYELLYGRTPFKGSGNRATLFNVVGEQLKFPDSPATSSASRDLIRGLLVKEPQQRLGVKRGATEIKQHPFFEGVNWALIRCSTPPEVPRTVENELPRRCKPVDPAGVGGSSKRINGTDMKSGGKFLDFEFF